MENEWYVLCVWKKVLTDSRHETQELAINEAAECNRTRYHRPRYFVVHRSELHLFGLNQDGHPIEESITPS